ncbi:hypothetical protein JCM10449v2_001325 [Rhodotorula kratochvilovae]
MCTSTATLFFGITVPALQLVVAARAWPKRRIAFRTVDRITALREAGTLKLASRSSDVILRVPGEIWQIIKLHTADVLFEDEEDALVAGLHDIGLDECRCSVCTRAIVRERIETVSRPLTLSHIKDCQECENGLCEVDGVEGLLDANDRAISRMLRSFDLELIASSPINKASGARYDAQASAAVGLPHAASADTEAPHGTMDFEHELLEIDPSNFDLPSNAQKRFRTLLSNLPFEVTDGTVGKTSNNSHSFKVQKKEKVVRGKKAALARGPAKWHLWNSVCDCF